MAKDPAFLFYPNDWLGGTMGLTRKEKGCYIDLLIAQFNLGPLPLSTINSVLREDREVWEVLSGKFKQDTNGLFVNERLAAEMAKRKKYSESRRDNISKRYKGGKATYVVHMENENNCINNNSKEATYVEHMKTPNHYREPVIPTKQQVWEAVSRAGGTKEMAKAFYLKHEAMGWYMNNTPIKNYVSLAQKFVDSWKRNDKAKERDIGPGNPTLQTIQPDSNV